MSTCHELYNYSRQDIYYVGFLLIIGIERERRSRWSLEKCCWPQTKQVRSTPQEGMRRAKTMASSHSHRPVLDDAKAENEELLAYQPCMEAASNGAPGSQLITTSNPKF